MHDGSLPAVLGMLLYLNTLPNGFVYDDHPAIEQNPCVQSSGWKQLLLRDFWGTPLDSPSSHHSYRPLATLTLRLNQVMDPVGGARSFHATNVLLHGSVIWALWAFATRTLGPHAGATPFLAALLFAVHPINTEAVAYAVGRADLLAALLGLAGMRAHLSATAAASAVRGRLGVWRFALWSLLTFVLLAAALAAKVSRPPLRMHHIEACARPPARLPQETSLMLLPACALFDMIRVRDKRSVARRGSFSAKVGCGVCAPPVDCGVHGLLACACRSLAGSAPTSAPAPTSVSTAPPLCVALPVATPVTGNSVLQRVAVQPLHHLLPRHAEGLLAATCVDSPCSLAPGVFVLAAAACRVHCQSLS